jgi:hypothetical protein
LSPTTTAEATPSRWESFHHGGPPLVPSSTTRLVASVVSGARPGARPGADAAAEAVPEALSVPDDAALPEAHAVAANGVNPSADARPRARRREIPDEERDMRSESDMMIPQV